MNREDACNFLSLEASSSATDNTCDNLFSSKRRNVGSDKWQLGDVKAPECGVLVEHRCHSNCTRSLARDGIVQSVMNSDIGEENYRNREFGLSDKQSDVLVASTELLPVPLSPRLAHVFTSGRQAEQLALKSDSESSLESPVCESLPSPKLSRQWQEVSRGQRESATTRDLPEHEEQRIWEARWARIESRHRALSCPSMNSSVPQGLPSVAELSIVHRLKSSKQAAESDSTSSDTEKSFLMTATLCDSQNEGGSSDLTRNSSSSEPVLYRKSEVSPLKLLTSLENVGMSRRKDSVCRIRKKSSVSENVNRVRKTSVPVFHSLRLEERRYSSRDILLGTSPQVRTEVNGTTNEPDILSWSQLLASIPPEERRASQIRQQHLVISIPVCVIVKDKPVTFTSLEVIEQTLKRLYPEIIVKTLGGQEQAELLDILALPNESGLTDCKQSTMTEAKKDRRLSVFTLTDKRRMSINTCIKSMKKDTDDYDRQLRGIQNVGAFAEEETLTVLLAKPEAIQCITEAMKSFLDKQELQLNACNSLYKMASASESNCYLILQNDGISAISATLRHHYDNVEIIRAVLGTVAYISTSVELAGQLVAGGLHSEILYIMSRHSSDHEIVRDSCFIIGNLLVTVEAAQQLMLVGGVHTIINMVKQFPGDEKILENVCRTLGCFAIYDETCQDVAAAGAVTTVLKVMGVPYKNVMLAECACWALASLTATDMACEELVRLGGVEHILNVLEELAQEETLQEYGVRVLCNLGSCETTVQSVCQKKVVQLIQKVLLQFPESVELLEIALVTLSQLMAGEEGLMHRVLAEAHCVLEIVNTMMCLPENQLIQEHGCKIIGNMAVHDELRKQVEIDGASKAVISALLTLDTIANIQEVGCLALMNLTADNKDNKVRMKNAGAVPCLVNTLREFSHDANIVLCALKALGNLVSLEEVCHLFLDETGLDTVVSLVTIHHSIPSILLFIALVLCAVTELSDLKEEEAILTDETLMRILACIQDNPDVTLYVCQALENFVRTDVGRGLFLREKRMGVILSAMSRFTQDNSHIHRCCCKVIAVVALYVDPPKNLITETTLVCVLRSMQLFPMDVELQIIACATISCIVHKIDPQAYPQEAKRAFATILQCMQHFPENKELQVSACQSLTLFHLEDDGEVHELIQTVAFTIKRHGLEPEVQRLAAAVLKPFHKMERFSHLLEAHLNSPTLKFKEFFSEYITGKK